MHCSKAGMLAKPLSEPSQFQVILIVLEQLLVAATGDTEELELDFHRYLTVAATLHDVLLATAGRLHHLVNSPVAVGLKIPLAE